MQRPDLSLDLQRLSGDDISRLVCPLRVNATTVAIKYVENDRWGYRYSGMADLALFYFFWGCEGFVQLEGRQETPCRVGDIVMLPQLRSHIVGGAKMERIVDLDLTMMGARAKENYTFNLASIADDGEITELQSHCAKMSSSGLTVILMDVNAASMFPLLRHLPTSIHIGANSGFSREWLPNLAALMKDEHNLERSSSAAALQRLNELFLVKCVAEYFDQREMSRLPRFSLRHPRINALIDEMHRNPESLSRSLANLARDAAMARSTFSSLFSKVLGVSPVQYLRRQQMERAAQLMDAGLSVCEITDLFHYQSDFAFRRAFKQEMGVSPTAYRKARLNPAPIDRTRDQTLPSL